MNHEYIIFALAFLGIFIFVLWCFPREQQNSDQNIPRWIQIFLPLADLFAQDAGLWMERYFVRASGNIKKWSNEAGYQWSPARIFGLQLSVMIVAVILFGALFYLVSANVWTSVPLLVFIAFSAWIMPLYLIHRYAKIRMNQIAKILPFAIDLICSSMSAGLDFVSSIRYYTTLKMKDPLSLEFDILLREIELGKTRSDALRSMAERIKSEEFDRFVSAIVYSLESGTAIIDVMQLQSDEVRRIRFSRLEQEIARVPSKMIIPIVLCIVPAMFIMILVPVILSIKDLSIFTVIFK